MPSFTAHGPSGPVDQLTGYTGLHSHFDINNGEIPKDVRGRDCVSWPRPDTIWMKSSKPVAAVAEADRLPKPSARLPGVARVLALEGKPPFRRRWQPPPVGADLVIREPIIAGRLRSSFPPHVALPAGYCRARCGAIAPEVKLVQAELSSDSLEQAETASSSKRGSKSADTSRRSFPVCSLVSVSEINVMKKGLLVALLLDGIGNIALFRRARVSSSDWDKIQPPETARRDIEALEVLPDCIRFRRLLASVMMGKVSLHQLLPIDVASIQGDLPHLSLEQLLMFRINNSPTSSYDDVHTGLLFKLDCLLAARLGDWVLERVMFQLFSPYMSDWAKENSNAPGISGRPRQTFPWLRRPEKKGATHSPNQSPPSTGRADSKDSANVASGQTSAAFPGSCSSTPEGDRCRSVPVRATPVVREGLVKDLAAVFGWRSFTARGSSSKREEAERADIKRPADPSSSAPLQGVLDGSSPKLGEDSQEPRTFEPKRSAPGEAGAARGRLGQALSRKTSVLTSEVQGKSRPAEAPDKTGYSVPRKVPLHLSRILRRVQDTALTGHKKVPALSAGEELAMKRLQEARDMARAMVDSTRRVRNAQGYLPSVYPMPASKLEANLAQKREIGRQVIQQLGLMVLAKEKKPELFPALDLVAFLLREDPRNASAWSPKDVVLNKEREARDAVKSALQGATRLPGLEEAAAIVVAGSGPGSARTHSPQGPESELVGAQNGGNQVAPTAGLPTDQLGKTRSFRQDKQNSETRADRQRDGGFATGAPPGSRGGPVESDAEHVALPPHEGVWVRLLIASSLAARCNTVETGVSRKTRAAGLGARQPLSVGGFPPTGANAGSGFEKARQKFQSKSRQRDSPPGSEAKQPCSCESTESEAPGETVQHWKGQLPKMKKKNLLLAMGGTSGKKASLDVSSSKEEGRSQQPGMTVAGKGGAAVIAEGSDPDQQLAHTTAKESSDPNPRDGWCECFLLIRPLNVVGGGADLREIDRAQGRYRSDSTPPKRGFSCSRKGQPAKSEKECTATATLQRTRRLEPGLLDVLVSDDRPVGTGVYWGSAAGDLLCKGRQSEAPMWRVFWIPEQASLEQTVSGDTQSKALLGELRRKLSAVALRRSLDASLSTGGSPGELPSEKRAEESQ